MMKNALRFDFKTRHAGISVLTAIIVLAGVLLVNILLQEVPFQADLTGKKLYSLGDTTKNLLDALENPVEIYALYGNGEVPENVLQVVEEYERLSRNVTVLVVDPDREPELVAGFQREGETIPRGSLVVSSESRYRIISVMELLEQTQNGGIQWKIGSVESLVTPAVAYVASGHTPIIYEIVGHQETPLSTIGYGAMLARSNYGLREIDLITRDIPEDAALVTLFGPRDDLSAPEAEKLQAYLENGGSLLVALDFKVDPYENITALLRNWDIELYHGLVFESDSSRLLAEFGDNRMVFVPYAADHETVSPLVEARLNPIFQATMGFGPTEARRDILEYESVLFTSRAALLRRDLNSDNSMSMELLPDDITGPVDLAITVGQRNLESYQVDGARIVALGTASSFRGLGALGQLKSNADLLLNLVDWAVDDEASVSVTPKYDFTLPLRMSTLSAVIYAGVFIVLIPLLCLGAGLFVYFRRRNA